MQHFFKETSVNIEDGLAALPTAVRGPVSRSLPSWCAKAIGRNVDEVAIYQTKTSTGVALMRTWARRGVFSELWISALPIVKATSKLEDGRVLKDPQGVPFTYRKVDNERGSEKQHWSANCADRTVGVSEFVAYDADGSVKSSGRAGAKTHYTSPVPDSISETVLDFLCRL